MSDRFREIGLRWLEHRDTHAQPMTLSEFCEVHLPTTTDLRERNACLDYLRHINDFDLAFQSILDNPLDPIPQIMGYSLIEPIASGGMGVVWRAVDERLKRSVAIKVMKTTTRLGALNIEQFQREAQFTARLAHPNLVPIHEMGTSRDGRNYYVMKLVEGRSLAQMLGLETDLSKQRTSLLRIFSQVCYGVAFAHRQSVAHLDLKPENIMVGLHGEVQVMDWGLAKELGPASPGQTKNKSPICCGTPGYMSPEQAAGRATDQRSDVYSLGVILGELLTGLQPKSVPVDVEPRQAYRERFSTSNIDSRLSRIALQCLATEPGCRPRDAGEIATRLDDYLYGIEREQQYRLFWRRFAIATSLFALISAIGLCQYQLLWRAEQQARTEAENSRLRTRRILDEWSLRVVDEWLDLRPDELTAERRTLIEQMQTHYDQLLAESPQSEEVQAACAMSLRRLGQSRIINSDYSGASAPLSRSRRLFESLLAVHPNNADWQAELATISHLQGAMFDSQSPAQLEKASDAYQVSIGLLKRLSDQAASVVYLRKLCRTYISQAWVLRSLKRQSEGLAMVDSAIETLESVLNRHPDPWLPQEDLASALNIRYLLLTDLQDSEAAGLSLRRAIDIRKSLALSHPNFHKNTMRLGINYGNLGKHLHIHGQVQAALDCYELAISTLEPILQRNADLPECRHTLRNVHCRRATALEFLGKQTEAIGSWEQAIRMEMQSKRPILRARLAICQRQPLDALRHASECCDPAVNSGEELFDAARAIGRVSTMIEDRPLREKCCNQATELLKSSLAKNYRLVSPADPILQQDLGQLATWTELSPRFFGE